MPFAPLTTDRLVLRRLAPADAEALTAYRSDPAVVRYTPTRGFDRARADAMIAELADREPGVPGTWFQLGVERRDTGALIGDVVLRAEAAPQAPRTFEIGFTLAAAHHRLGFGAEAVRAVLGFAFGALQAHRVFGNCDARNAASAALMATVGMRREAHHVEDWLLQGFDGEAEWTSSWIYAVLAREWGARSPPG
jgi:RimJ/RimL family protein N-acetyltransferase